MLRAFVLSLLLVATVRADSVVVNQDGSATITINLTAEQYTLARIGHEAMRFDDPNNTPASLSDCIGSWLLLRIQQLVERARELVRQRAAVQTPAQELAATQAALSP